MLSTIKEDSMLLRQQLIQLGLTQLMPMQVQHRQVFIDLYSSNKVMRQVSEPLSVEVASAIFERAMASRNAPRSHYYWIIRNSSGAEAGLAAVIVREQNAVEVGVMLLPAFSRQGLALAASAALFECAFKCWGMERVLATHKPGNLPVPKILDELFMECTKQTEELWHWQLTHLQWQKLTGQQPYQFIDIKEELYGN
jgi:RimJ/RimL family protein N-acetyltransferase